MAKNKSKAGNSPKKSKKAQGIKKAALKANIKKSSTNQKFKIAPSKSQPKEFDQVQPAVKKTNKKLSITDEAKLRLESAHFRFLNEQLYTSRSSDAWNLFQEDPQSFYTYHKGFQNQVAKWPVNPLDLIIKELKKEPKTSVFADFGCGEARLSASVPHQVHSFDLVAANENVTACDMAEVPLENRSVNAVIFCLSLMGTNVNDFLIEANRVLTVG